MTAAPDLTLVRLFELHEQRVALQRETSRAVAAARAAGHSWAWIGQALRISRQAAHQQFGPSA